MSNKFNVLELLKDSLSKEEYNSIKARVTKLANAADHNTIAREMHDTDFAADNAAKLIDKIDKFLTKEAYTKHAPTVVIVALEDVLARLMVSLTMAQRGNEVTLLNNLDTFKSVVLDNYTEKYSRYGDLINKITK